MAPPERIAIDIEVLRRLVGHMRGASSTLNGNANIVRDNLDDLDLSTQPATTLSAAGWWADDQLQMLDRRLSLAEGIDMGNNVTITSDDPLLGYATRADAQNGGRDLARRVRDSGGNSDLSSEELAELERHLKDPDFINGFYDELGPNGLAWVVGGTLSQEGLFNRRDYDPGHAQRVLGSGFGYYTRLNPTVIDNDWLGQFNHISRGDPRSEREAQTSFENNLLVSLIPHGRFSPEFLGLIGDRMYGTNTGDVRDTGWGETFGGRGPTGTSMTEPDLTPLTYQAVVLEGISQDMLLAGEFADRHLDKILDQSRNAGGGYGQGDGRGVPAALDRIEDARIAMLRTATLAPSWLAYDEGLVDPADLQAATENAEVLLAHLAYLQATSSGGHVSKPMQALYGEILHTYRDDMYRSVTNLTPGTSALVNADGGLVDTWPGRGDLWSPSNAGTPGVEIPKELWAAMLQEALRNGTNAPVLAADAELATQALGPTTQANTLNPTTSALPNGQQQEHLLPADLDNYRSEQISRFFTQSVAAVVTTLENEAAQWQLDARTSATNVSNVLGEVGKAFSPGKPVDVVATIIKMGVEVVKAVVRGSAGKDDMPADVREALTNLEGAGPSDSTWTDKWRTGAELMWANRAVDPIEATTVTDSTGKVRVYTGDPVTDGFVSGHGAPEDFMNPDGTIKKPEDMTAAQRTAYERWLTSPAVVANNQGGRQVVFGGTGG